MWSSLIHDGIRSVRIAFLTDVHGNLPALEAVLADAREQGAEQVWDGGDAVGYHPWPTECVQLLADTCAVTIMGNYDRKVLKAPQRHQRWLKTKDPLKAHTLIWAWEHLTPVAYDTDRVAAKIRAHDLPVEFVLMVTSASVCRERVG